MKHIPEDLPSTVSRLIALAASLVDGADAVRMAMGCSPLDFKAYCSGRMLAGDREVMRMSGTWVSPPSPDGKPLHPLPWEAGDDYPVAPQLALDQLDAMERAVLRRVELALRAATHGDFMQHFFVPVVRHTPNGAESRMHTLVMSR